jgi:hypothetical protein
VGAPIQCVAGLVSDASATTSAERRCEKNGDDDYGDDRGASDDQSAIHGVPPCQMVVSFT